MSRAFSCVADEEMFNRQREIEFLSRILVDKPQFSIITGPVDSSKTRLIEKVLHEVSPNKMNNNVRGNVCVVNLRKGTYYTVASLCESFSSEMNSWLRRVWDYISLDIQLKVKSEGSPSESEGSINISFSKKNINPTIPLTNSYS